MKRLLGIVALLCISLIFISCGGGGGESINASNPPAAAPPATPPATPPVSPTPAVRELFVAERGFGVYALDPSLQGDSITPSRMITKGASGNGLDAYDVAVDMVNEEIFVTDITCGCVLVYPLSADENTVPIRIISGINIQLSWVSEEYPLSISVDTKNDEILVLTSINRIFVFPRTASGDISSVPPLRILSPPGGVSGIAVDSTNDELLLATQDSIQILSRQADGTYLPARSILANPSNSTAFVNVAVDTTNNEIFVIAYSDQASIQVYGRMDNGNATPKRTIEGTATGLYGPNFIAIDPVNNEIFVSNYAYPESGSIKVYGRTASGNVTPLRSLSRSPQNEAVGIALAMY
jgi:DNA-binding beta-propeller fold protein YncE